MPVVPRRLIDDFLAQRRIAMVGVSRKPQSYSRTIFREFCARSYDAVPVTPNAAEIEGRPCLPSLKDVQPPPDAVLIMTAPRTTEQVLRECVATGAKRIWLARGTLSPGALEYCREQNLEVIPGLCPHMFLPEGMWIHRFHGFLTQLAGQYPR